MSVDEFREQMVGAINDFYGDEPEYALVDTLLCLELLPGITLKRLVELKDRLVVLDDNQTLPDTSYGVHEHLDPCWVEEAVKNDMVTARFRRVSRLGEKEGD